jgi:lysophospholipid acyltransferase (LPLAT)-like uncharacterized protein
MKETVKDGHIDTGTDGEGQEEQRPPFRRMMEAVVIFLVTMFQRFTLFTSRRVYLGKDIVDSLIRENRPFIFGIWHCNVYMSPILYRGMDVYVLISKSRDGDLIDRVVRSFGNRSIRGSTSRGGTSALKAMIRVARQNSRLAFTPDGPRGPAFKVQQGIIAAASACGIPIVPAHYESTHQKVAGSWDSHRVPLPFGTLVNSFGDPIYIPRELDEAQFEEYRALVEARMLENQKRCEEARDRLLRGEKI